MIGILYSRPMLRSLMEGKRSFEMPAFYLEAARHVGEDIVFFSLADINWTKRTVRGWNGVKRGQVERAIPPVILNRTRTSSAGARKRVRRLKQMGSLIMNEHNVISKLNIHRALSQNKELLPYLPQTHAVTHQSVEHLLAQHDSLFLKPSTASVGSGIIRIRKGTEGPVADINVLGRTKHRSVTIPQIVNMVRARKREYLVQQGIPLLRHEGRLVDFRVSVQKNETGTWQFTGMVGRVAKKGAVVTNLHCGGTSMKVQDIFRNRSWNGSELERSIAELGVRIAETLESHFPHTADIGLDIALDEQQHPWLIEVNFRDLRITFRDAGEGEKWRATFATPVYHAAYAVRQRNERRINSV